MKQSQKYQDIGERLMLKLPEFDELKESDVRIAYLESDKAKVQNRKMVFGECHKVDE